MNKQSPFGDSPSAEQDDEAITLEQQFLAGVTTITKHTLIPLPHLDHLGSPSRALYKSSRCRCLQCRACDTEYRQATARSRAYGTWNPYVDVGPVRDHLRLLRSTGASIGAIAHHAGITESAVASILYPKRGSGAYTTRVRRTTADAIMAGRNRLARSTLVVGFPTARRVQALVALGWPYQVLGLRLGCRPEQIWHLAGRRTHVQASTAREVHDLYLVLSARSPVPGTDAAGPAIARARTAAENNDWPLPSAWTRYSIEEESARPYGK